MKKRLTAWAALALLLSVGLVGPARGASAQQAAPPFAAAGPDVKITDVLLKGAVAGENITFQLDFTAECERPDQFLVFVAGDVALQQVASPAEGHLVGYEADPARYVMRWPRRGTYKTSLTFAARPRLLEDGAWREVSFLVPASRVRELEVVCDRTDLEVRFPGALRVTREVKDGKLAIAALLGPGLPFAVRWKPQVEELDAALVLGSEANAIASVRAGALRLDSMFLFDIAQGKLNDLSFVVPQDLSVTQVRGQHIRDWRIEGEGPARRLNVSLNRPLTKAYALQIVAEAPLPKFPTALSLPVIVPEKVIRSGGHLSVGTDSAIHLVVDQASGLTQTEPSGFPRVLLDRSHDRPLPTQKALYYTYASAPYQLRLSLDDIVPSFDVLDRHAVLVREEDLAVEAEFELDVRDAPLRDATLLVPRGLIVAALSGPQVADYTLRETAGDAPQEAVVHFSKPLLGRTLIKARLELGRSPLDRKQVIGGISIRGAKSERGYLAIAAERSVQIETPVGTNLREVHTGSIPMRVPEAQFAYRYREPDWSLELLATKKPAGVLAEAFHLVSLGEGALYGYVVVNYVISGAPVDEFRFRVPKEIEHVEAVGGDVRNWPREGETVTVKLQRKVLGDYNLAVSYSRPWKPGEAVTVGGIECLDVERQSGFLCVTSHLNARVVPGDGADPSLLEIKTEEIPANYRLLLNAPILKAYKYVAGPHRLPMKIETFEQQALLPAVVEVMDLTTEFNVTDAGATESVTRVRYKIKNASNQFLTLALPRGATIWSTRLIERDGGGNESATRLTASLDQERGTLMVPLRRLRDPNEPMTVELVYGQEHPEIQGGGELDLTAPGGPARTTFGLWTLRAPRDWAVLPADGGNMVPKDRAPEFRDLGSVMRAVARAWAWAFLRGLPERSAHYGLAAALLLCAALLFVRRKIIVNLALALLLLALLAVGVRAATSPEVKSLMATNDLRELTFTRALSLNDEAAFAVSAKVVPSWRRYATVTSAIVVPAFGLAALILAGVNRRGRRVLLAVGVACLLTAAARFPLAAKGMAHALTWGLPVMLALWLAPRVMVPVRRLPAGAAIATAALLLALLPGCALFGPPMPERPTVNEAAYQLKAEKDSMEVRVRLAIRTPGEMRLPLLPAAAVLLTPEEISDDVKLERADGGQDLVIRKKGDYALDVKFLHPLPGAGDNQVRRFDLAVPRALRARADLSIPEKGIDVAAPTAVFFTKSETASGTAAHVVLGPNDPIVFLWQPRARERKLEETAFYADLLSVVRFDTGLARGRHRIRFQIAQGELKDIRVRVPDNATVTSVEGEGLGAWRFDPATHEIEARLTQPVGGEYALTVTTQIATEKMPATVSVGTLKVLGAVRQRGILGLAVSPEVYITAPPGGQPMNVDDFAREAAAVTASDALLKASVVRHAYRLQTPDETLRVGVAAVQPEIRSTESATFTVSDERLVYNGEIVIAVAKAGVFSADLLLPEGYDIDTLVSPEVSHWDETSSSGARVAQVHFRGKLLGATTLKIALSRPMGDLPDEIDAPRVQVRDSLKHSGQLSITTSRNVRLTARERQGVSEISALEIGVRSQGALAFSLLRPDWALRLKTEIIKPRVNVEFLHVAEVSDGLARHTHYLRYRFYNAGQKVLDVRVPKGALGLEITGPEIAHLKETEPGVWRVELAQKQFEQPYLLRVRFETQFDRAKGEVTIQSSEALNVDLQRGHLVALSTDRVELAATRVDEVLQPADARGLPRMFGAGDLSSAAFCWACPAPDYAVAFRATRHTAASVLEATVLETGLNTVLSESGETITHCHVKLRVGSKRHLEARLPAGSQVWSLNVNLRPEAPSRRRNAAGEEVLLVPLAQGTAGDLPSEVDLIYVTPPVSGAQFARQIMLGPRFDLPLQNVTWRLFLPEQYTYDDFEGTLNVNEESLRNILTYAYDLTAYDRNVADNNVRYRAKALELQARGSKLAKSGYQQEARQALSWANNYAFNDAELNEDTRVQLHNLIKQQAVFGLVDRRNQLRQQKGEPNAPAAEGQMLNVQGAVQFDQAQAERVQNSLHRDDSQNLDRIIARLIEMQEQAARPRAQLMISVPVRGRLIELTRPLQVKPDAEMRVEFKAKRAVPAHVKSNWAWGAGLAVVLILLLLGDRGLVAWRESEARKPSPPSPTPEKAETAAPNPPSEA